MNEQHLRQRNDSARWYPPQNVRPEIQRQAIGERLYALIALKHSELAGKITGMLLEGLSYHELIATINSRTGLDSKVKMALQALGHSLDTKKTSCLPRHVEEILLKEAERCPFFCLAMCVFDL